MKVADYHQAVYEKLQLVQKHIDSIEQTVKKMRKTQSTFLKSDKKI